MKERREYVRLSGSLKVIYKVVNPQDGQGGSLTEDVSGGGIRLPIKQRLWPGTILELEMNIPESTEPIKASGKVVWFHAKDDASFPFVVGIKFIKIDPFDRGKILNYIRKKVEAKGPLDIEWIE